MSKKGFGGVVDLKQGQSGFEVRRRLFVGEECIEDGTSYVVKLVDGLTNLTETKLDDNVIDGSARIGLGLLPTKRYVFGDVPAEFQEEKVVGDEDVADVNKELAQPAQEEQPEQPAEQPAEQPVQSAQHDDGTQR